MRFKALNGKEGTLSPKGEGQSMVGLRQNINMDAETTSGPLSSLTQEMKGERGEKNRLRNTERNGKFSSNRGTPQCGQIDIV